MAFLCIQAMLDSSGQQAWKMGLTCTQIFQISILHAWIDPPKWDTHDHIKNSEIWYQMTKKTQFLAFRRYLTLYDQRV